MRDVVIDKNGKVLYLGLQKFREIIFENKSCFICATPLNEENRSEEHVFPKWMLRDFKMHASAIDLPNKEKHRYGGYVVPCCVRCNSRMGSEIEEPISTIIKSGYDSVIKQIDQDGPRLIYDWLARIFLKTHLKDRDLRTHVDHRKSSDKISDTYIWEGFYLPFCFSRAFYSGSNFSADVMGSFLVFKVEDSRNDLTDRFFYVDDTSTLVALLQIRDTGFIAAFNDFGIGLNAIKGMLDKIDHHSINPSQLAEIATHLSIVSSMYGNRPMLRYGEEDNSFRGIPPEKTIMKEISMEEKGTKFYHFVHKLINKDDIELAEGVKNAEKSFLWDANDSFNKTDLP